MLSFNPSCYEGFLILFLSGVLSLGTGVCLPGLMQCTPIGQNVSWIGGGGGGEGEEGGGGGGGGGDPHTQHTCTQRMLFI